MTLITIIGFFSGYGFSLIGRVCSYTGGTSYRDAWSESVGKDSSWIPAATCTMKVRFVSARTIYVIHLLSLIPMTSCQ
jgi:hypothetical protein